jgi:probable addiction module antidote protein
MKTKAENFDSPAAVAAYLTGAFETGDSALIAQALGIVARMKGMSNVAKQSGLGRESLYRSLSKSGSPALSTVMKVLDAIDIELGAKPKQERRKSADAVRPLRNRRRFPRGRFDVQGASAGSRIS